MEQKIEQQTKEASKTYMLIGYTLFVLLGLYHLMFYDDYIESALNFGIALVFDPFDQKIAWNQRHPWQKAWLIVHLGVAAALLVLGVV